MYSHFVWPSLNESIVFAVCFPLLRNAMDLSNSICTASEESFFAINSCLSPSFKVGQRFWRFILHGENKKGWRTVLARIQNIRCTGHARERVELLRNGAKILADEGAHRDGERPQYGKAVGAQMSGGRRGRLYDRTPSHGQNRVVKREYVARSGGGSPRRKQATSGTQRISRVGACMPKKLDDLVRVEEERSKVDKHSSVRHGLRTKRRCGI